MERLGVLALRAAAVCGNAVLSSSHQVAQFSLNIPAGLSCGSPPKNKQKQKKHYIRGSQVLPTTSVFSVFFFFFFWNDACVLKCRPRSLICVAKSQFYIQRFQIPEGHLQRQVQPPCDHPISGEAQGKKGFFIRAKKGGIVPISSGKRATVGINRSVLGNKSQGMMDQDLGMSKAGGEGDCKVAAFILGVGGWGHQNILT